MSSTDSDNKYAQALSIISNDERNIPANLPEIHGTVNERDIRLMNKSDGILAVTNTDVPEHLLRDNRLAPIYFNDLKYKAVINMLSSYYEKDIDTVIDKLKHINNGIPPEELVKIMISSANLNDAIKMINDL